MNAGQYEGLLHALNDIRDRLPASPAAPETAWSRLAPGPLSGQPVPAAPAAVVYPRFVGVDQSGDFVWELASGRYTWGDDPFDANRKERTFTPERYLEKYGPIEPLPVSDVLGHTPVDAKTKVETAQVPRGALTGIQSPQDAANLALARVLEQLNGWIRTCRENHDGMGHRGEPVGGECWTQFHPSDIRRMVNDAARELGVAEFPEPVKGLESQV